MKHAILLLAHQNLEFINSIIDYFDDEFTFFIHMDKKCKDDYGFLASRENTFVFSKYDAKWGSVNLCKAVVYLMMAARKKNNYNFYHLISGSDLPIKPLKVFKLFFSEKNENNYIEYHKLPYNEWAGNGGLDRVNYYWLMNNRFDIRGKYKRVLHFFLKVQRKLKISRAFKYFDGNLYGGSQFWSLSEEAVNYILDFLNANKKYIKRFNHTHCSDEMFFQTILANSSISLVNNSLRYINWNTHSASPTILTEKDFENMVKSNSFFARKFDKEKSQRLIEMLNKNEKERNLIYNNQ